LPNLIDNIANKTFKRQWVGRLGGIAGVDVREACSNDNGFTGLALSFAGFWPAENLGNRLLDGGRRSWNLAQRGRLLEVWRIEIFCFACTNCHEG